MKPRILQNGRLSPALEKTLLEEFDTHPLWKEPHPAQFLAKQGGEFSGLVTSAMVGADATLIDALPALKVIASRGVGHDTIDMDAAKRRGIRVSNTPGVLTDCVADLAFGALIAVARSLAAADRFVRRGDWARGRFPTTTRVSGKRLGIFGLGRIGRTIARRGSGFDMEIGYTDLRAQDDVPYVFHSSLTELARWADFLVISAAGGPSTRYVVSAEVLEALGPEGFLVNCARGSLVDEKALVKALAAGAIAGAALDVFETEPVVPPQLLAMDNVVLFPHVSSSTRETFTAMEDLVLANLRSFYRDGSLQTPVAA
jgi:lactate dehydrogenase-like 2-hydroxyacid dehydrogenase